MSLILRNARISGRPGLHSLVLGDRAITAVCAEGDPVDRRRGAEQVDLAGGTVTAGLTDAHLHPLMGTAIARGIDLSGCRDLNQLRAELKSHLVRVTENSGGWLLGWGLDPNCFGTTEVDNAVLADVFGELPVFLRLFDAHSALVSTEALRRAGIAGPRTFASRSRIVCASDGRLTGLLLEEDAMAPVLKVIPEPSFQQRRDELKNLLDAMAATGLTGGHVMDCDGDAAELYADLDEAGELPMRLRIAPWRRPGDDSDRVDELTAWQGRHGRLWQISGVKLFMDGTIDNGTAWLQEPDCHGESTAAYWQDPHDYTRAVHELAGRGISTATHAIGDAAVAHVLAAVGSLPPAAVRQHRIEHIETIPDELVPAFARLGVTASMQPTHATHYTRADHSDNWSRRLGSERANRAWRCRDLYDAGAVVALGSDWPIAPFDPRAIMADAQLRRPWDQPDLGPVAPAQALTAEEALAGYTAAPASAVGDRRSGRVEVGCRADLTVWDADPLAVPPDELAAVPIRLTVVDGEVRHRDTALG